jgi:hypothetical protein
LPSLPNAVLFQAFWGIKAHVGLYRSLPLLHTSVPTNPSAHPGSLHSKFLWSVCVHYIPAHPSSTKQSKHRRNCEAEVSEMGVELLTSLPRHSPKVTPTGSGGENGLEALGTPSSSRHLWRDCPG